MALVATVVPWMKRSTSAGCEPARAIEGHDVGEGAADVDADLHREPPWARLRVSYGPRATSGTASTTAS